MSKCECEIKAKHQDADSYTLGVLREMYDINRQYVRSRCKLAKENNISIRSSGLPEDISENIIKYILRQSDAKVTWDCSSGDLYSPSHGRIECKSFTSDGPISFSPSSGWSSICFLDAREWLHDRFVLYRLDMSNLSDTWRGLKVSASQTFGDQISAGRRPRITWDKLFSQLEPHISVIFTGSLDQIQISDTSRSAISRTTGTETALPASL